MTGWRLWSLDNLRRHTEQRWLSKNQNKLNPNRCHYPLITYLTKKDILLHNTKERLRLNIILKPYSQFYFADPRCWLREDVQTWIRHLAAVHGLPAVQPDRFLMNGKALCLMTMEMFCQRVPLGGKMLYKDFQLRLSMALYGNNNKCWKTRKKRQENRAFDQRKCQNSYRTDP